MTRSCSRQSRTASAPKGFFNSLNGHDVGTATYYGGSGRFKGIKGGEKFDTKLMGDRGAVEVEGTIELP